MHDKEGESIMLDEEQRSWDRKWSEEDEKFEFWVFGRRKEIILSREISGRNGTVIARILFIGNLSFSMNREVSRIKKALFSYRRAIEDLIRGVHSKDSWWIEVAIERLEDFSMDRSSYRELLRAIKNTIKNSWRVSIDSIAIERYQEAIEIS